MPKQEYRLSRKKTENRCLTILEVPVNKVRSCNASSSGRLTAPLLSNVTNLPNPCECAEERRFRRNRASDCLSEASSSSTPAGSSTAGCPQRSAGTQTVGSPFLLLTLLLAKQKKSESPAAATERHPDLARCMLVQSKNKGAGVKSPISHERSWGQEELGSDTVLNPYFFSAKS